MSQTNPETPVVEATAPESTPEAASPETTQETKPTTIKVRRPAQNERKALCLDTLAAALWKLLKSFQSISSGERYNPLTEHFAPTCISRNGPMWAM